MWSWKTDDLSQFTNFSLLDKTSETKNGVWIVIKGGLTKAGWKGFFDSMKEEICNSSEKIKRYASDRVIFPPLGSVYRVFELLPPSQIRVVIIGQDPYFHFGEAMGIAFSVKSSAKIPSSLRNIFKEIMSEYPKKSMPENGDLTRWVDQGVFLVNTALTVSEGKAGSHLKEWKEFTLQLMKFLNNLPQNLIIVAWGNPAQTHLKHFDVRHERLMSPHPSGLSAHKGFYGNGHFLKINKLLRQRGESEIDW